MAQFVRHDLLGNLYTHMLSHDVHTVYKGGAHMGAHVPNSYAAGVRSLTLKLIYGITPAEQAKTEVTMRFLVENCP